jgi:hypothetical protein
LPSYTTKPAGGSMPSLSLSVVGTATSPIGVLGGHHSRRAASSGVLLWYGGYRAKGLRSARLVASGGRHPLGANRNGA